MTSSKIQDGRPHARVWVVIRVSGPYIGVHLWERIFVPCANVQYISAVGKLVWKRFKTFLMTKLMLEDKDCPATQINLPSAHHQPTISLPSAWQQPTINLTSIPHQLDTIRISCWSKKDRQIVTSFYYISNHKFTFKVYRDLRYQQIKVSDGIIVNDSLL